MSFDQNIYLHLSLSSVYIFHLCISKKKQKTNISYLQTQWGEGKQPLVWQRGRVRSGLWSVIHRLAQQKWDDGGVCCNTHYPVNPPASALPNSLGLRTLSPSLLWRYCNTWKQQPLSQVVTNWDGKKQKSWKCTQSMHKLIPTCYWSQARSHPAHNLMLDGHVPLSVILYRLNKYVC